MKIEKNKIVFGSVLAVVIIFIIAYSVSVMSGDDNDSESLTQTAVPDLDENQKEYKTKLEAIDALKEVRETNAPSIYDEKNLDSLGFYDPDFMDKEKVRIVDSIYKQNKINYTESKYVVPERYRRKPKVEVEFSSLKKRRNYCSKGIGAGTSIIFCFRSNGQS